MLPAGLAPATLAKGYRWAHGLREPARDTERRTCRAYSEAELKRSLQALGWRGGLLRAAPPPAAPPPPPPALDPLLLIWAAALQRLPYPSTRMLFSQQAELIALRDGNPLIAELEAVAHWRHLIDSKLNDLEQALGEVLGRAVALVVREVVR
jgi:hypothetical protein